jgi:hypothetical protein
VKHVQKVLSTATCFHVHKGINVLISIGNKGIFRRRAAWSRRFFTEPEKGSLCGCACLERTPQPLACAPHGRLPQLQLARSTTEQYYWLFSTRPLDTNHPEHAGARDTGKALLCPPSTADSTLDYASLMKILAHHGTQPELEFSLALFPSASSSEDSIIGDPFFPALYSIVVELPVHSSPIFLVRPGDTR